MSSFGVIIGVIACLLISKSESKQFCEAFKQNANQIDYGFDYWFEYNSEPDTRYFLIIGTDYWNVIQEGMSFKFESKESLVSPLFSNDYSLAYSGRDRVSVPSHYVFLNKNHSIFTSISLSTDGQPWDLTSANYNERDKYPAYFDSGFIPSIVFCTGFIINRPNDTIDYRQTLVSQNITEKGFPYKRQYLSFDIRNSSFPWTLPSHSEGRNYIIGLTGIYGQSFKVKDYRAVLYTKNQSIWYCVQSIDNTPDFSVDGKCLNESLLIDCTQYVSPTKTIPIETTPTEVINTTNKTEWISSTAFWVLVILVGIVCVLLLCALLVYLWFNRNDDPFKGRKFILKRSTKSAKLKKSNETLSTK